MHFPVPDQVHFMLMNRAVRYDSERLADEPERVRYDLERLADEPEWVRYDLERLAVVGTRL